MKNSMLKLMTSLALIAIIGSSCRKNLDINVSPNALTTAPLPTVLTSVTTNVGFTGGSDLHRFTSLWVQQFAGQGAAGTQTLEYEKYNIQSTDVNGMWGTFYSNILMDIEYIIANSTGSPWYSGIAKILKAWCYQHLVDTWGDVPFSEATKGVGNRQPKFDDDAAIYPQLIALIDAGIADLNASASALVPGVNETIFGGNRTRWIKMGNTLKMRMFLHLSEVNPTLAASGLNGIINTNAPIIAANNENFQMAFIDAANAQNPIHQFEQRRLSQFFPNSFMVNTMNNKQDPRRAFYFTPFPYTATPTPTSPYVGATPGQPQSIDFSRMHTFLRGTLKAPLVANTSGAVTDIGANHTAYTGAAPIRLLTFAEYNFIRAEASLRFGSAGTAESFFQAGITASMQEAGVAAADITAYLALYGTLSGTPAQQLQRIIEEKYIANYGVALEPYNDWRRTGYPVLSPVAGAVVGSIPTIFYYPQSEINSNPNCKQKGSLSEKVFWDN
ncbi:MAG: SusD/RagB family nutrient-binding outer membrane lipoprotein [Bacteroidota bacterium]|jgi:hypothetical protein